MNDAEIEAKMQERINSEYPPAKRERALRLGGSELVALNEFFDRMTIVKAQMIADRDAELAAQVVETVVDPV